MEPRLTATPLIRSPRYYGHFFLARQNGHTFAYKKTPLMRSPVNTANGHFFKFPTHIILYNLTPLIRPREKSKRHLLIKQPFFLNFHYRALTATAAVSYLNCKAFLKIIVIYDKGVDNEVLWLNQLQSRTTPWQSFFVINMSCFFTCSLILCLWISLILEFRLSCVSKICYEI